MKRMTARYLPSLASPALLLAGAVLAAATPASAALHTYTLSGATINHVMADPGLVVDTAFTAAGSSFMLDDGQSITLPVFTLWTDESTLNANPGDDDDLIVQPIDVLLGYSDVAATGPVLTGTTVGAESFYGTFLGNDAYAGWGILAWDGPQTYTAPDRTFTVELSGGIFNQGPQLIAGFPSAEIDHGQAQGITVEATITQLPEPASLALVGLGAGVLLCRRRRTAPAAS